MDRSDLNDQLTRRLMLKRAGIGAGMLALPGILAACGSDDSATSTGATGGGAAAEGESPELTKLLDAITSTSVIVATHGGTTEEARRAAFWDPFTERTGVKVITPPMSGALGEDQLQGRIKPRWDSFHNSAPTTLYAVERGRKPIPKVPMKADLLPKDISPYMWQAFQAGYVAGSVKGAFDTPPTTQADYFDLKKFPGKRAFPTSYNIDGVKEFALLADGVAPDELYPLDLERANAKISSIWDDLVFYETYPQIQTFLSSHTVSMAFSPSGILARMPAMGVDVDIVWDQALTSWENQVIIPDAPDMDAVLALSAWCNDPQRQARFSELTFYGPSTQGALDALPQTVLKSIPNAPGRDVVPIDYRYYAENFEMLYADNEALFNSH